MTIANTIIAQLGGNKFAAMTGAKNFVALDRGLQFDLPARIATNKATRVTITLSPTDLYTMAFYQWKPRALEMAKVDSDTHGMFADDLRPIFESKTGLFTRL